MDEKDRALPQFAHRLNHTPDKMEAKDIDGLRGLGFTDQNVFDVVVLVAYFNFMDCIADGFGVEPEPDKEESYRRDLREVVAVHRPNVP